MIPRSASQPDKVGRQDSLPPQKSGLNRRSPPTAGAANDPALPIPAFCPSCFQSLPGRHLGAGGPVYVSEATGCFSRGLLSSRKTPRRTWGTPEHSVQKGPLVRVVALLDRGYNPAALASAQRWSCVTAALSSGHLMTTPRDDRCKSIELILSDVDGVLTDGGVIYDSQGIETSASIFTTGWGSSSGGGPVFASGS